MENIYRAIWSDEALNNLKGIIEYLEKNWTKKEIVKFVYLLEKRISVVVLNPFSFPIVNHSKKIRKAVVSKQVSIFYLPDTSQIYILSLFDNRRNPDRIKYL